MSTDLPEAAPAFHSVHRVHGFALALLTGQTLLIGWTAYVTSPVLDELAHLAAGLGHWEFGTFDLYRVNPPLVRMIAALPPMAAGVETDWMGGWADDPYSRPEFGLGRRLPVINGPRTFWLFTLARWGCLPFAWLGGWVCFRWARELYGDAAGLTALALWCLCPNVLAWGATICPDLPAASTGVWAAYAFWHWLKTPNGRNLTLASIACGVALLTKSTWIILFALWPLAWCLWRPADRRDNAKTPARLSGLAILLAALYIIYVGYGFAGALRPLGEFKFISHTLGGDYEPGRTGNRFRGTWLAAVPSPLPADYLLGLDVQRYEFEQKKWSYLRGEQRLGGWWWYYLYALGVKTPLGTLALFALACLTAGWRRGSARRRDELIVLLPAIAVLVLVSSQTGFNRYLRYVLPALPGLFVWMSRVAAVRTDEALESHGAPRRGLIVVAMCLLATAVSSLRVWPHSMTYFHELVGGPAGGHRHLLDANLDWGQGLLTLRDWVRDHPDARPLHVADFGWVAPSISGIESQPVPRLDFSDDGRPLSGDPNAVLPGWYAASVNHVLGYRHYPGDHPVYTWLHEFEPVAQPGYTHWVYHLTEADVQSFRARHHHRVPD